MASPLDTQLLDSDEEVFWGPVTAKELEITWRKMREQKMNQAGAARSNSGEGEHLEDDSASVPSDGKTGTDSNLPATISKVDEIEDSPDIGKLSMVESPKTCYDLLVKSNCLKFIDEESFSEKSDKIDLPIRNDLPEAKENNISEVRCHVLSALNENSVSEANSNLISGVTQVDNNLKEFISNGLGERIPAEIVKSSCHVDSHFPCGRDIILVNDYSIISSDGESEATEPKTYTVLKPLTEGTIDSLMLPKEFVSYTPLSISNSLLDTKSSYDDNVALILTEETSVKELDSKKSSSVIPEPCFRNIPDSELLGNRATPLGLVQENHTISTETPSKQHSKNFGLENCHATQLETPSKYSVISGDQYFDADSDSSINSRSACNDFELSSEIKSMESCAINNMSSIVNENSQKVIDNSAKQAGTFEMNILVQSSNDSSHEELKVNSCHKSGTTEVGLLSEVTDFASLNKNPSFEHSHIKVDMDYRESEIIKSPANFKTQKPIKSSKSRLPKVSSKTNVSRPIIKPARLFVDVNYSASKATNSKPFTKDNISRKPNPSTPIVKTEVFKVPTCMPTATPKKNAPRTPTQNKVTLIKPLRNNMYKDIKSPIADYIHKSPSVIENRINVDAKKPIVKQMFPKREKCPTPLKKINNDVEAENIDPSRGCVNKRVVNTPLKQVCYLQSDKALIVEKKINSQLPKIGDKQKDVLVSQQPKLFVHKGTIQSPGHQDFERKLISKRVTPQNINELSFADLPHSKNGDISILQTFTS